MSDIDTDSYTDSEYSDYDDEYYNTVVYEPEELSITQYNIILCEIYNEDLHGQSNEAKYNYLVHYRFKKFDINLINELSELGENEFKPEIAQCIYLESQHCVAILKTFWIKLIQRTWKNIFKKRKEVIVKRCQPTSLNYKQINGKWPKNCLSYPGLRGMLSAINFKNVY